MTKAKKPIKILLFSTLFPHSGEPTLGIFVANRLSQLLEYQNVEATVVAPVPWFPFTGKVWGSYGRAAAAKSTEVRGRVKVYHPRYLVVPKVGMLLTPLFLYWSAKRCISRLKASDGDFDIIDAHYLYPDGVAAARLAKWLAKPFVMTARGSDVTQIAQMRRPGRMIVQAAEAAAALITVSNNLRHDLIEMGVKPEKITTLRNGVDLDRFQETNRQELRDKYGTAKVMLFAGWLIPRKRLDIVLGVAAKLDDVTTIIVGDGPMRNELEAKVHHEGLSEKVIFCGQVSPEDMPRYYSAADVLLLPSDREGWANVLLESMACGTPVVTRAVGGAPDLITQPVAGRVVDSEDTDDIAAAVSEVLMADYKREHVRSFAEGFDWRETSAGQAEIFSEALIKHRALE